jgi:hypothetical protein
MFSNRFERLAKLAVAACAGIALAGCQDAAAPTAPEVSNSLPVVKASHDNAPGRNVIKDQYIVVLRDGSADVDVLSKKMVGTA